MTTHAEQPMPVPNDSPDVQSMVIEDIRRRREVGIQRYGTALQPHNGRDALRDAYEEALDLACYLRQAMAERDGEPVTKGVRYWVQVSDEVMSDTALQWPSCLRPVRPDDSVPPPDNYTHWWLFEDDDAPPELAGKKVELTFSRIGFDPYETRIEQRVAV
jgi:hypothetical protein